MKEISQIERMLFIMSLISKSNGMTFSEISKKTKSAIDVSPRTIRRDLDSISKNFNIYEEIRNKKTYYYIKDYCLEKITFNFQDYMAIYFAKEIIKNFKNIKLAEAFMELMDRILDNSEKPDMMQNHLKIKISGITKENKINDNFIKKITSAIVKKNKIKIIYTDSNTIKSERIVDPYFISIYEGCYHLLCFCNTRNDIRDFRISRIKSIEVLNLKFVLKKDVYETIEKNRFDKLYSTYEINLVIEFSKEISNQITEYESCKADSIKKLENGNILFKTKTNYSPEIVKWILQFGKNAKVVEPKSLFEEIKEHVSQLHKIYNTD